ncbi:hypothetical protein [Streptomyces antimicrobicus]|uniref:Sortase n=1 Tax=Streptomyces antimicrobicus TaxID=2883108 RepID=A0ABS8B0H9_9ACTN|nr:hypothetical protein [Streptomyces antimicrobicus]MCB5178126.1 hypothetical protein [Streptomyces antimicrobicus]
MRRRTAHALTATALTCAAFAGPVAGAVAAADFGAGVFAPGDFAELEIWPRSAAPGTAVTVNTTACGPRGTADGDATMVGGGRFRLAPAPHEEVVVGQFRVAPGTRPGTYEIGATCADGRFATGDLVVTERGPQGHVRTGVGGGTTTATDPTRIAAGAAVLAATAVGGTWLLRRRASGTRG